MLSFDDALNSVIQEADAQFEKIKTLSEIPFADLLTAYINSENQPVNADLGWSAVLRKPVYQVNVNELWPEQLNEFYSLCDGVEINHDGDTSFYRSSEAILGEDHKPKLSKAVKRNLERKGWKKRAKLPVFDGGGTQSLINIMNDDFDHEISLEDLDKQLVLKSIDKYNFLVYIINDIDGLNIGEVIDIEGGVSTRFTSLKIFFAFETMLHEDW